MTVPITVVIPVGPRAEDCAYFDQCLDSVNAQTIAPRILVVDDMHSGAGHDCAVVRRYDEFTCYRSRWVLGVANAFNHGVALAETEHVALLGADDWLEPDAIQRAQDAIARQTIAQGYYWWHVRYNDDRPNPDQAQPCGAAVVTKALWAASGGFPVEAAVGRSDVMLVGTLLQHPEVGTLVEITDGGRPPYNVRIHDGQHTASRGPWIAALESTAQAYWTTFEAPRWGRYS